MLTKVYEGQWKDGHYLHNNNNNNTVNRSKVENR
jgi:hypothetical protein